MAIQKRNLKKEYTLDEPKQYVAYNEGTKVLKFAAVAGATATDTLIEDNDAGDIYQELTPVQDNGSGEMVIFSGTGTIDGFLLGAVGLSATSAGNPSVVGRLQVSTTDEVLGLVLTKGAVRAEDVADVPGVLRADLEDDLRSSNLRALGIDVLGLDGVI